MMMRRGMVETMYRILMGGVPIVAILWLALAAVPVRATQDPAETTPDIIQLVPETETDRQVRSLAAELRCPVCQGLSIQDSPSELAQEMRNVIRSKLVAGETPDQVRAYFVGRYGEWILLQPERRGFNLAVYLLPVGAVLAGLAILIVAMRRWLGGSSAPPADGHYDESDPDLAAWEDLVPR